MTVKSKQVDLATTTMFSFPVASELLLHVGVDGHVTREQLRARYRDGSLDEITFAAVVYIDGRNGNHVRFRSSELAQFAASFEGVPFLRNHDLGDVGSRDGTVVASELIGGQMHQQIRLTTQRGMGSFLDGVIDRFSIGWYFDGVECSICGENWMGCSHWPGEMVDGQVCELIFMNPRGKETSAVNAPAVQGTRVLEMLCELKERGASMADDSKVILLPNGSVKEVAPVVANVPAVLEQNGQALGSGQAQASSGFPAPTDVVGQVRALRAEIDAERVEQLIARSGLSEGSKEVVRLGCKGQGLEVASQLIEAQRKVEGARVDESLVKGIRPIAGVRDMLTPLDRVQSAWDWILGDTSAPIPAPSMRSIRDLYLAVTGDYNWYGKFDPEWSQLAAATTTTLAGLTVNSLNKVTRLHFDNLATYRWYENIVAVDPHDGSTQPVQMIMMDGIANLPIVQEGAVYTEAAVGDSKESMSFTKRGHYVGITLETIRRSDIARIQAVPRLLVQGAVRARSAAIAGVFTVASGTGPTLADDSTVLFHTNHTNLATTAFADTTWAAARTRIWKQSVPGTSKPLGLWPKFGLFPIDLFDTALSLFGYGAGDVGKPGASFGQQVNPYGDARTGDPRPVPIAVPDWTDTNDWAYIVDPLLHPVIHMAYANVPQGGMHAMPEIFEVQGETTGLMFSNDTLPVKIRDWWSYGVATYVGIGKNNV